MEDVSVRSWNSGRVGVWRTVPAEDFRKAEARVGWWKLFWMLMEDRRTDWCRHFWAKDGRSGCNAHVRDHVDSGFTPGWLSKTRRYSHCFSWVVGSGGKIIAAAPIYGRRCQGNADSAMQYLLHYCLRVLVVADGAEVQHADFVVRHDVGVQRHFREEPEQGYG